MRQTKRCPRCDTVKDRDEFVKNKSTTDGLASYCKPCFSEYNTARQAKNPEATRAAFKRWWDKQTPEQRYERRRRVSLREYGMTIEEYDEMFQAQDGKCAICLEDASNERRYDRLYVDHDHVTGRVRALLCQTCNFGVGMFKDDEELMQRAIAYIKRYRLRAVEEKGSE